MHLITQWHTACSLLSRLYLGNLFYISAISQLSALCLRDIPTISTASQRSLHSLAPRAAPPGTRPAPPRDAPPAHRRSCGCEETGKRQESRPRWRLQLLRCISAGTSRHRLHLGCISAVSGLTGGAAAVKREVTPAAKRQEARCLQLSASAVSRLYLGCISAIYRLHLASAGASASASDAAAKVPRPSA